jgi:hypothetical protein
MEPLLKCTKIASAAGNASMANYSFLRFSNARDKDAPESPCTVNSKILSKGLWHLLNCKGIYCTVTPRCIVFQGDGKQKQYIRENNSTGKPLKIIDKNNLMIIIITSC